MYNVQSNPYVNTTITFVDAVDLESKSESTFVRNQYKSCASSAFGAHPALLVRVLVIRTKLNRVVLGGAAPNGCPM